MNLEMYIADVSYESLLLHIRYPISTPVDFEQRSNYCQWCNITLDNDDYYY